MRATTKKKHNMGRRLAILIGLAATGVMALGAQTGAAAPDVVKYDTTLSLTKDGGWNYHGFVWSDRDRNPVYHPSRAVRKCMVGRRVVVFKLRPGVDRRLGAIRSTFYPRPYPFGDWWLDKRHGAQDYGANVRAKVERKVGDGFVCRADRAAFGAWPQYWPQYTGQAPPTCKGKPATIVGTEGNEEHRYGHLPHLTGTPGRDVIVGLGGDEEIEGGRGNDLICGRAGLDSLAGGKGRDRLLGQAGVDYLYGGPGSDTLLGQAGIDELDGGWGKDRCYGGKGFDITERGNVCEVEKSIEKSGVPPH